MNQNEREQFFTDQVPPGDFETITGYTRHRGRMMTAQYLNEVVDKYNGMEVADQYGTVWGWVHDCHKNIGKWVPRDTHDKRVKLVAEGVGIEELRPIYEPYYHTQGEESIHTPASFTEGMEAHINDPVNPDHYRSHPSGVECIEIIEHMNFNLGNTIKYVWRAGLKTDDPAEDLKKALWYLRRELSRIEGES